MPGTPKLRLAYEIIVEHAKDPEWFEGVLDEIAGGSTMKEFCEKAGLKYGRMMRWVLEDEKRYASYLAAEKVTAMRLTDEALEIADGEGEPYRDKMKIDTRLKIAERYEPRFRASGQQVNVKGEKVQISFADWNDDEPKQPESKEVAGSEPDSLQRLPETVDGEEACR